MSVKAISAIAVTSKSITRTLIIFDETKGVITEVIPESESQYSLKYNELKKQGNLEEYNEDHLLFASFGDIHIHAREDASGLHVYKEDFDSVKAAGINGGLVFACDMPNNPVAPVDDETYLAKFKLTLRNDFALIPYAGIGPSTRALSFLVPYKVYMGHSVGNLFFKDCESLENVLPHYKNQYVSFHCEDPALLEAHKNQADHFLRRPISAEIEATKFAIALARKNSLKAKLCHYSSGDGLNLIRAAKKEGLDITCEVTPQHLYFSEEEVMALENEILKTSFQMNPPIRKRYDRDLLLDAFKNGEIDYLATDHAPHSMEEKKKGMSGLTGLDTYSGFVTWLLVEKKIDPKIIALTCSENPGSFYNNFHQNWIKDSLFKKVEGDGLGFLEKSYSASFTILNLNSPNEVVLENLKTKALNSPFLGVKFPGLCVALYFNGQRLR